jgi:hypothetical protein
MEQNLVQWVLTAYCLLVSSFHPGILLGTSAVSNSEMRYFCAELGRTRVFAEAYV